MSQNALFSGMGWNPKLHNYQPLILIQCWSDIFRLEFPFEEKYHYFYESSNTDITRKDVDINEKVFENDVEFTNISVIKEDMKKG